MGDRTWARITVAACDFEHAADITGFGEEFEGEEPDENGNRCLFDTEAGGGGYEESHALQEARIPFILAHGAGCEYGPGIVAFDGETYAEADGNSDEEIVVVFDEQKREPSPASLEAARECADVKKRALAAMMQRNAAAAATSPK